MSIIKTDNSDQVTAAIMNRGAQKSAERTAAINANASMANTRTMTASQERQNALNARSMDFKTAVEKEIEFGRLKDNESARELEKLLKEKSIGWEKEQFDARMEQRRAETAQNHEWAEEARLREEKSARRKDNINNLRIMIATRMGLKMAKLKAREPMQRLKTIQAMEQVRDAQKARIKALENTKSSAFKHLGHRFKLYKNSETAYDFEDDVNATVSRVTNNRVDIAELRKNPGMFNQKVKDGTITATDIASTKATIDSALEVMKLEMQQLEADEADLKARNAGFTSKEKSKGATNEIKNKMLWNSQRQRQIEIMASNYTMLEQNLKTWFQELEDSNDPNVRKIYSMGMDLSNTRGANKEILDIMEANMDSYTKEINYDGMMDMYGEAAKRYKIALQDDDPTNDDDYLYFLLEKIGID